MRSILATGLLLFQLRPMLGMALCQAFSGGDGSRLEIDCPMPEGRAPDSTAPAADATDSPTSGPAADPALTLPADPHQCVLAEFCLTTPPAISSAQYALINAPPDSRVVVGPSADHHRAQIRTPPVPPPKV